MANKLAALLVSFAMLMAAAAGFYTPPSPSTCGLKVGYYHDKCPHAEAIVRGAVGAAILRDPGVHGGVYVVSSLAMASLPPSLSQCPAGNTTDFNYNPYLTHAIMA
uniref:Peroxidase n=1 Tax=Oryza rufipogon TaxID=4529 RepID=A0A0E0NVJ8_ORYRU